MITNMVYTLIFVSPLCFSILCLLKIVLVDWQNKKKVNSFFYKAVIVIPLVSIAVFLMYFITVKFVFTSVEIPHLLNFIGLILFVLYLGAFFGFAYGLGALGHGGIAPKTVVMELYKLFFDKKKKD